MATASRKHKYILVRGGNLYPIYLHVAPSRMTTHEVRKLISNALLKGIHTVDTVFQE